MKKIVQLALLMGIISATTVNYCWEWSDLVPNRLQNWYQNWQIRKQIRKQELQQFKQLEKEHIGSYTRLERIGLPIEKTPIEFWERKKRTYDELPTSYKKEAQEAARNIAILKKYKDLPQVKIRNNFFGNIIEQGYQ